MRCGRWYWAVGLVSLALFVHGCGGTQPRTVASPRFSNPEIEASYKNGEEALLGGDYVRARRVLMRIISRYPGENDLAQVQWLIAKTYDMEGKREEAISEYKRFLANYPDHPDQFTVEYADDRIRQLERAARPKPAKAVRVVGALSTDYEYQKDLSPDPLTTLNRMTTRLDAQIRNLDAGRGKVVVSALRSFDFEDRDGDRSRLQKLYGDWRNAAETFSARFGRQPSTPGALATRYDGAELHYRFIPTVAFDAAAGFPVEFSQRGSLSTDVHFYEAGLSMADAGGATGRVYAVQQFTEDVIDREAVGGNLQAQWGRVGLSGNLDYDTSFGAFNDRFLSVEYALRESLHLTVARDVRNDPYLQMRTALQDDAATTATPLITSVSDLLAQPGQSEETVRDLARNHTINSTDTRVGLRWTIGPHWLTTADYSHTTGSIIQTGNTRVDRQFNRLSVYAAQTNAWQVPDTASALVVYQDGSDVETSTLSLMTGERLGAAMLLQLRARVEYTNFKSGPGSDSVRYIPGVMLNYDPLPHLSLAAEGEYTREDRFYEAGRTAVSTRLNVTVLF
ncbi:MAG TPA: outer membrane protein assembly factor BamD [Nitrospiria bacterium]|nr:outer membrane protein assembly factor BamD [Nitrospiria bacterium]